jgi:hypothetical protein
MNNNKKSGNMKKIIFLIILCTVGFFSCKDMDSTYKEFLVPEGISTYPQRPDSLKIYAGFNRVEITWFKAKDPKVVKARIYWNNYTDSINVAIPADRDIIRVSVDDLPENTYTFYVKTFDAEGNTSVPSEITGTVYGNNYMAGLTNREITDALRTGQEGQATWSTKTTDLIFSEIRYKTDSGGTNTLQVLPTESNTICPDVKFNEPFEYRSVFLPNKGIDTIKSVWTEYNTPFLTPAIKKGVWTALVCSDASTTLGGMNEFVDDNLDTYWHSAHAPLLPLPHWVVIDMASPLDIYRIKIYRLMAYKYCKTVEIFVSNDPDPAAESWEKIAEGVFGVNDEILNIDLPNPSKSEGQYMKVFFGDSYAPQGYINPREIFVYMP